MSEINTPIKKVVAQLTAGLSPRNREIIARRFGLKTGTQETLEAIGVSYGITRERVRQIKEASLAQIRQSIRPISDHSIQPFVTMVKGILESQGGIVREDELFMRFSGVAGDTPPNAALVFVLTLAGRFHRVPEDDDFHTFWSLNAERAQQFRANAGEFVASLAAVGKPSPESRLSHPALASFLSISKQVGKNVFGEVGLMKWAEIKPRGVRDKSFLVLKKEGKPKHFREITQLINEANFGNREAHVQTVHNELIKDPRFVLVGRGIYGLAEWGYEPGTVKEVIANLLRKEGPQPKDKIIAHVTASRMVKPNTIVLGMQDKNLFQENEDGKVALKEA